MNIAQNEGNIQPKVSTQKGYVLRTDPDIRVFVDILNECESTSSIEHLFKEFLSMDSRNEILSFF